VIFICVHPGRGNRLLQAHSHGRAGNRPVPGPQD
jgi:hypothetical protein